MMEHFAFLRRTSFALAMIVAGALVISPAAQAAKQSGSGMFYVPLNRSELITTNTDMSEVVVTDPTVANVLVHGKRKVSVIGLQIGQTTLRIFDADKKLIRDVDVYVTYDLPAVRKALKQFLPNERIGVSMVNTRMALTGEVTSAAAAASAMEIAQEFVYGKLKDGSNETRVQFDGDSKISPIINMMKISSGQQVMLRIRIGEAARSAVKNLGVSFQALGSSDFPLAIGTLMGRTGGASSTNYQYGSYKLSDASDTFGFFNMSTPGSTGVSGLVEALERDGMIKILAEPNLTALSGEEAQFLAGGEFPVVVPQDNGTNTIEFKPYGVALKFIPYVISPNRIRIQVNPEVSDLTNENAITTSSGIVARGIITRRASTTVELAPGESFMIAGLVSDNINTSVSQLPGSGEIPVLGALFRSTAFKRSETELVIAVTPYLVDPVQDGSIKLPSDNFKPASFMDSVFFGAIGATRSEKTPTLEGPAGFMTE